jgi:hypothetical protein
MLTESPNVMQERNTDIRRRWFQDDEMDLIVWYRPEGLPEGFQLCYRAEDGGERALTWRPPHGFSHARVDSGDARPDKNMTPILLADGPVPWTRVKAEFNQRAGELESAVRTLVLGAFASEGS